MATPVPIARKKFVARVATVPVLLWFTEFSRILFWTEGVAVGYTVTVLRSEWRIAATRVDAAYAALRELIGHETINRSWLPNMVGRNHFSFVDPEDFETAPNLVAALRAWRWDTWTDEDGSLVEPDLIGGDRSLGDELILFATLAPFVDDRSFIDMYGRDDGVMWRWLFQHGDLYRCEGRFEFGHPKLALA